MSLVTVPLSAVLLPASKQSYVRVVQGNDILDARFPFVIADVDPLKKDLLTLVLSVERFSIVCRASAGVLACIVIKAKRIPVCLLLLG